MSVLTHDPRSDVELLAVALRSGAGHVGALGSRATHERRLTGRRESRLAEAEPGRLRAPTGLDIGARTPEETAISIAAELAQNRWSRAGLPLGRVDGAIHHDATVRAGR